MATLVPPPATGAAARSRGGAPLDGHSPKARRGVPVSRRAGKNESVIGSSRPHLMLEDGQYERGGLATSPKRRNYSHNVRYVIKHAPAFRSTGGAGARGRGATCHEETPGFWRSAQHPANAAQRHLARTRGKRESKRSKRGLFDGAGRSTLRHVAPVPHSNDFDSRISYGKIPSRAFLVVTGGTTGERVTQARFRVVERVHCKQDFDLNQRAHVRRSTDQGRTWERRREITGKDSRPAAGHIRRHSWRQDREHIAAARRWR